MSLSLSRLELFAEFGFKRDPFGLAFIETTDIVRVKRLIKMAVSSKRSLSIVAERGTGKTSAVNLALREMKNVQVIRVESAEKERISVGDIERSIMFDLSSEPIRRTREVRARQIRRILGIASREKQIVLVLEESHRMHGKTLRSLKSMLDMEWMGAFPLFTVIMVGQFDPMRGKNVEEIKLRSDTIYMKGLTTQEIKDYMRMTVSDYFDDDAIESTASLSSSSNYLDLQEGLLGFMMRALESGRKKVETIDVFEGTGGNLSALIKELGLTYTDLQHETGISRSTLCLVATNKPGTLTPNKVSEVRSAIMDVVKKHAQKQESKEPATLEAVNGSPQK